MKKYIRQLVAGFLIICMMFIQVIGNKVELLAAKNEKLDEYVITTKNQKVVNRIKEKYDKFVFDDYSRYGDTNNSSMYMGLSNKQVEELNSDKGVIAVEKNIEFEAAGNWKKNKRQKSKNPDALNWNLRMIGADKKSVENGDAVNIAVMDSGIDFSEDTNVVSHINLVDDEKYISEYNEDITGHGTAIAGIISDIHKNAKIYSIRVLDSKNIGKLDRIIEGIYWCIDNDIQIINMSFGSKVSSPALKKAVEDAKKAGILMIAATGNGSGSVEYPAAYDEVVAVGAIDSKANITSESNSGEQVELVAPGKQVNTEGLYGGNVVVGGTSMSVAHVVGAASVIWSQDTSKSENFVRELLHQSAKRIDDPEKCGYGLIDLKYALKQYKKYEKGYKDKQQISSKNVVENSEDAVIECNENIVETYDELDLVEGSWTSIGHEDIINKADKGADRPDMSVGCYSTDILTFIKNTCVSLDIEDYRSYFRDKTLNVFHGRYNYLGTMDYLYKVLRDVYTTGDSVTVNASCKKFSYNPDCQGFEKHKKSNATVAAEVKEAIRFMASAKGPMAAIGSGKSVEWKKRRGLAILGMLMHTIADTYAHKTKVPTGVSFSDIKGNKSINIADIEKSLSDLRREIQRGINFHEMQKYLEGNYEDNSDFYQDRYLVAQRVSNLVLRHFIVGSSYIDFDRLIAEQSIKYSNGNVIEENKLSYLKRHTNTTYGIGRMHAMSGYNFYPFQCEYGIYLSGVK